MLPQAIASLGARLFDDETVDRRTAGAMAGTYDQRAVGGQFALTAANGFFYQLGGADIGVHGVVGLRHVVPRRPEAESSKLRSASKNSLQEKVAGLCQKSPLDEKSSVAGFGRPLAASAGEQLGDVGGVEQVALVAELAVDGDRAFFLLEQPLAVGLPETDQGVGRTFPRATAMEDQRLRFEQAHGFLVVEAVQDGLVVQRQQLFGGQRVGQGGQVLPTGLAGLGVPSGDRREAVATAGRGRGDRWR